MNIEVIEKFVDLFHGELIKYKPSYNQEMGLYELAFDNGEILYMTVEDVIGYLSFAIPAAKNTLKKDHNNDYARDILTSCEELLRDLDRLDSRTSLDFPIL